VSAPPFPATMKEYCSLYEALYSLAQHEQRRLLVMLKEDSTLLERRLIHNGTALSNEYHSKVLALLPLGLAKFSRKAHHGSIGSMSKGRPCGTSG
jgi:hypothetical protein